MSSDARSSEVIYEAPARSSAWWLSAVGGAAFVAFVSWIAFRMLDNRAVAVAVLLLGVAVPLVSGRAGPLRIRRVTVDHRDKAVTVAHATGTVTVPFADVTEVTHGEELVGEGVTVDVVTLTRTGGAPVRFSVIDRAAAEGAARALRAVLSLPERAAEPAVSPRPEA
jgi:hypothetical protein